MFDSRANFRSLVDDPQLIEKIASARAIVGAISAAGPRTEDQLQDDVSSVTKAASSVADEIQAHLRDVRELRAVKAACVVHIAAVCARLLA